MNFSKDDMLKLMPSMKAFAVSLCDDFERADDLVQETLLKAWNNQQSFQKGTNLRAWLFTILRNTYFSEVRRRRREVEVVDESDYDDVQWTNPSQEHAAYLNEVRRALHMVPEQQRRAMLLTHFAGFSYDDAAKMEDACIGTIKSRVNRGHQKLMELLGDTEEQTMTHGRRKYATRKLRETLKQHAEKPGEKTTEPVRRYSQQEILEKFAAKYDVAPTVKSDVPHKPAFTLVPVKPREVVAEHVSPNIVAIPAPPRVIEKPVASHLVVSTRLLKPQTSVREVNGFIVRSTVFVR